MKYNLKSYNYYFLFFLFIIIFYIVFNLIKYNQFKENFNLQEWEIKLKNNLSKSIATVLTVPPNNVKTEDCYAKCDAKDCEIMNNMQKNLLNCSKCHENPKKCFRKSVIGGNCDDCLPNEKQIDCKNTKEFGCVPPHNIYSYEGSLPYFIQVPDTNLNSPYDKKCIFCWQIHDYI